jgi:hypothetical protein
MSNHVVRNSLASIAELANHTPDLYKMLSRVAGQRRRQRTARILQNGAWIGAGLVVGAGLATLLSPTTGAQVRRQIANRAERVRRYVAPRVQAAAREVSNGAVTS